MTYLVGAALVALVVGVWDRPADVPLDNVDDTWLHAFVYAWVVADFEGWRAPFGRGCCDRRGQEGRDEGDQQGLEIHCYIPLERYELKDWVELWWCLLSGLNRFPFL